MPGAKPAAIIKIKILSDQNCLRIDALYHDRRERLKYTSGFLDILIWVAFLDILICRFILVEGKT